MKFKKTPLSLFVKANVLGGKSLYKHMGQSDLVKHDVPSKQGKEEENKPSVSKGQTKSPSKPNTQKE